MPVSVSSRIDAKEILASGSVILFDDEIFELSFSDGDDKIILEFVFIRAPNVQPTIESKHIPPYKVRLRLINWDVDAGLPSTSIGALNGKPVTLGIMSSTIYPAHMLVYTATINDI